MKNVHVCVGSEENNLSSFNIQEEDNDKNAF